MSKKSNSQQVSEALTVTIPRLQAEKAELLAALKELLAAETTTDAGRILIARNNAGAAIVKAEGRTP